MTAVRLYHLCVGKQLVGALSLVALSPERMWGPSGWEQAFVRSLVPGMDTELIALPPYHV